MERGLIEMEWGTTAVEYSPASICWKQREPSLKNHSTKWQWQTLWDKLWLSWTHDKYSCDSGGVMSFQAGVLPVKNRLNLGGSGVSSFILLFIVVFYSFVKHDGEPQTSISRLLPHYGRGQKGLKAWLQHIILRMTASLRFGKNTKL